MVQKLKSFIKFYSTDDNIFEISVDRISPICIPDSGLLTKNFIGQNPFLGNFPLWRFEPDMNNTHVYEHFTAGWGRLGENLEKATVLQQVQVPVIPNAKCKEGLGRYRDNISFSEIVLCAGFTEGGKDSCGGASGRDAFLSKRKRWFFQTYFLSIIQATQAVP